CRINSKLRCCFRQLGTCSRIGSGQQCAKTGCEQSQQTLASLFGLGTKALSIMGFEDDVDPLYVAFAQQPAEIGIVPTLRAARTADLGYDPSREFWLRPSAKLLCH